ncbi:TetR/AcrR family transcriptional regulator [Virgibacillus sp. MSJ-26]|uniref:TetR/AcrR family transcriptional regulator n=1 Tax=Virgibacillus sp. MSJ-26 TaxID=2841522 RepID=UPI001C10358E|nr:TetR/AcrR family transcriptional regulator [Virgibacillus sp. MSJ-26]MBU5465298.1 TetR/AcrR family transcriptional regulator [Virgibacillus sp. MSJ-26]
MNEKKLKIMDIGLTLFSEKGYHSTSIQEIATEAGISKGAFYLYYQSKEDFMASSIDYIYLKIMNRLDQISNEELLPREKLAQQINILLGYIESYKGFILRFFTESISIGDRMDSLIEKMNTQRIQWMKKIIEDIYGDQANNLLIDIMIQFEGVLNAYFKWIVMYNIKIDSEKTSKFITRRLDDIVNGMISQRETPLITKDHITSLLNYKKQDFKDVMQTLYEKITSLPIKNEKKNQLYEVVATLKKEKNQTEANPILLQGLLAHFAPYPVLHDECEQLAELWGIELLQNS